MTDADAPDTLYRAMVLDATHPPDRETFARLRADPGIEVTDRSSDDHAALTSLPPDSGFADETRRWVYYPWRRAVVHVLGPRAFRRVRLDRNRNLITVDELERLDRLRVGVIGLSVGHTIAHTLAAEGLCGELRLADFDRLELSNLNRVPASVFDLGVNKAVACARRIAELDPYLPVDVFASGITTESIDAFLDGLDIVIEECDSLDIKVLIRDAARERKLPVLMATSSGGLLDVERFDEEPDRPVFHGLLGDVDRDQLARLSSKDKVPHVLRVIDAAVLRPRMQASLIEVGKSLATWPQLSSEVAVGAATVAEAVRRIGLREKLRSGRVRIDVAALLDDIGDPSIGSIEAISADVSAPDTAISEDRPDDAMTAVAAAAARAPSGGNTQPWQLDIGDETVTVRLDTSLTSAMDVGYRASAVAIGAATFNARVAAAAHGLRADVEFHQSGPAPLTAIVRTAAGADTTLADQYEEMLRRETNRHIGVSAAIDPDVVLALTRIAESEGARLRLVTGADDLGDVASLMGEADRIRYLTPRLHAQMIGELRWPGDPLPDTGIDVRSLELDDSDLAFLEILRSDAVMANLSAWNAGSALGEPTHSSLAASSAIGVVSVRGDSLVDYARGGSAVEAMWIRAQEHGLAVQPMSPAFLYARNRRELDALSPAFSQRLGDLQYSLERLLDIESDESLILILRLCRAPRPSVPSRRRQVPGRATPT